MAFRSGQKVASYRESAAGYLVRRQCYGLGDTQFNIHLADFAVWDVVLSAGEISALASGIRPHTLDKQTILYLPLDGLASPEPDFSGGNNSGTVTGTTFASGPPVALFTRSPALLSPSAAAGGVTITSAATIAAFTQIGDAQCRRTNHVECDNRQLSRSSRRFCPLGLRRSPAQRRSRPLRKSRRSILSRL